MPAPANSPPSYLAHQDRHDLRGILAAIRALGELLEDEVTGPLNAVQQDHVRRLLANVDRFTAKLDAFRDADPFGDDRQAPGEEHP